MRAAALALALAPSPGDGRADRCAAGARRASLVARAADDAALDRIAGRVVASRHCQGERSGVGHARAVSYAVTATRER